MERKIGKSKIRGWVFPAVLLLSVSSITLKSTAVLAQAPATAPAASANRFVGAITAVSAGMLIVKTDAGVERKVTVPDGIRLQRIAPGEKDLSKAATIQFAELAVGDRVLVRIAPAPDTDPVTAVLIIVIPRADLAQKQQHDRDEWQRHGVGGLVKSVDAGTGVVVITSGAGPTAKTITLKTSPTTVLRRYAAGSVSFDAAKPAPIELIQVGDQLRARGAKNADGTELTAEEVVSGSFRNISGTIASLNATEMTMTMKDLVTKQMVTVHVGPDTQMRKLPEMMAKILANMTKPIEAGAGSGRPMGAPAAPPAAPPIAQAGNGNGPAGGPPTGMGGARGGDLQQMLSRAPVVQFADLHKDDAVMLVSTQGSADVTAITLLAGVEPLLQAPASTQNMLLSNWNMSSGGAEAAQ